MKARLWGQWLGLWAAGFLGMVCQGASLPECRTLVASQDRVSTVHASYVYTGNQIPIPSDSDGVVATGNGTGIEILHPNRSPTPAHTDDGVSYLVQNRNNFVFVDDVETSLRRPTGALETTSLFKVPSQWKAEKWETLGAVALRKNGALIAAHPRPINGKNGEIVFLKKFGSRLRADWSVGGINDYGILSIGTGWDNAYFAVLTVDSQVKVWTLGEADPSGTLALSSKRTRARQVYTRDPRKPRLTFLQKNDHTQTFIVTAGSRLLEVGINLKNGKPSTNGEYVIPQAILDGLNITTPPHLDVLLVDEDDSLVVAASDTGFIFVWNLQGHNETFDNPAEPTHVINTSFTDIRQLLISNKILYIAAGSNGLWKTPLYPSMGDEQSYYDAAQDSEQSGIPPEESISTFAELQLDDLNPSAEPEAILATLRAYGWEGLSDYLDDSVGPGEQTVVLDNLREALQALGEEAEEELAELEDFETDLAIDEGEDNNYDAPY